MLRGKEWLSVLIWPVLGIILIGTVWLSAMQRIDDARTDIEENSRAQTIAAARAYALQLGHMVEQIDQIILRLQYSWEDISIPVNLEKERALGLFPEDQLLYASIFNRSGNLATSTLSSLRQVNVANFPYFQFHQRECCAGLLISPPSPSVLSGRQIVRFTRRLARADGSFDGIAIVSVEPEYLVTFQESGLPGKDNFVAVRLTTGQLLANKLGNGSVGLIPLYRDSVVFSEPSGIVIEPASKFTDGTARLVAWKKLEKYPVVAVAGISVQEAMLPFESAEREYRKTAMLASMLLALFSVGASYFAARSVFRRRETEETRETYRLATDAANEGFYMIRPIHDRNGDVQDFRLDDCNNRAAEFLGTTRERLIGMKATQLKPESLKNEMLELSRLALEKGVLEEEFRVPARSPLRAKWVYRRIVCSQAGMAVTIRDISAAKEHEKALADMANNDSLTQLPNRHWLNGFLPAAIEHALAGTGHLAILFIDLDNFKNVNDTLGHDAGDELLAQAAKRIRNAVRSSDHVARLGGDEFVVILDHVEAEEDVSRVATAVVATIGKSFSLTAGVGNEVSASIGISLFPEDATDAETLLKYADIAMYAAKAEGKGRYAFYKPQLSDSLISRLSKERALREAVANDDFLVHYQPRVDIRTGRMTSMEALVRWQRPQLGLVFPFDFIDEAEDMGIIVKIGELVLEKVCHQISLWQKQGLPRVPVSVNVSAQQLKAGKLSEFIGACLGRHGIAPSLIEAELTESAIFDRSSVVSNELAALRALGIKLMIDDFGTGYSSMAQLRRLDVDVLKVDQTFTKGLTDDSEGLLFFRAITSMAGALNLCVVAEGVETRQQLNILRTLACDEIQGYLVSKPIDAAEMSALMMKSDLLRPGQGPGRLVPV